MTPDEKGKVELLGLRFEQAGNLVVMVADYIGARRDPDMLVISALYGIEALAQAGKQAASELAWPQSERRP